MADIADVFQSEDFKALPLGEQLKAARRFPEFAGMPAKEQGSVLYQINAAGKNPQPEKLQDQGFWKTLGTDLAAIPGAIAHPIDTLEQATAARRALVPKAQEAYRTGHPVQAAGYYAASAMPFIGPAAARAGEELGSGQYGQGAAHATELLAPFAAKEAYARVPEGAKAAVERPFKVGAKAVQNFAKGPNPEFDAPEVSGGRIARLSNRLEQAYKAAERTTPDPQLAARNAARAPGRVEPVEAENVSAEPIKPPADYVRRAPLPKAKAARPLAARVEPTPQEIPNAEPIKPPEGRLPSGRKVGGIQNQTPYTPKPAPSAQLVDDVARGQFGKPFEKLTASQQATARKIATEVREPASPATPKAVLVPAPSGPTIELPEGSPEHYGQTGQSFGNRMAKDAIAKDSTIIKHLASKGITPEQFEAADEAQRNVWLRDVNQANHKSYDLYRGEKGANSAQRLLKLWRWAAEHPPK